MIKTMTKHPLVSFFVLAYAITWIFWVPMVFLKDLSHDLVWLALLIGSFGPMFSGIILSIMTKTSKQFWKSNLKFNNSLTDYIASLGIPLAILFIVLVLKKLFGVEVPANASESSNTYEWYVYPVLLLFMIAVGGGNEEPGWRGFALIRLLSRFNPLTASLIIGIIWTFWHTPLMFIPGTAQEGINFGSYAINVTALSIILTWIYIKSKGSALLAIFFHSGVNAINNWIPSELIKIGGFEINLWTITDLLYVFVALIIIIINHKVFFNKIKQESFQ